ncbi:MAG: YigZ family protein, partial [Paraprevotella sp.]|nr:YigZ family protein [Paraprevotella sp.]
MVSTDVYRTIKETAEGEISEKRSKFLAFAHPVKNVDEVKEWVEYYQKKYYDARHCCYAYMLGSERKDFRA